MRFSELTAASGAVDPFPGDQADKRIDDKRYRHIHTQLGSKMLLTIVPKLSLPFSVNRKRPPVTLRAKKKGSDETVAVTAFAM